MNDDFDTGARGSRLRLWELRGGLHCSVVGTCLAVADLRDIAERLGQRLDPATNEHEIHARFVQAATCDGPIARAMHRLLDKRYDGALRKVAKARGAQALSTLWAEMRDAGMVPGAYWAMLTSTHVPEAVRVAIFGDVHMLSHLNGRSVRETSERAARAEARIAEHEERLRRAERRSEQQIAERDRRIAALEFEVARLKGERAAELASRDGAIAAEITPSMPPEGEARGNRRAPGAEDRSAHMVAALRAQLRTAETELARQRERIAALEELLFDGEEAITPPAGAEAAAKASGGAAPGQAAGPSHGAAPASADEADPGGEAGPSTARGSRRPPGAEAGAAGISVLYLGGLTGQMPRLRSIAESWGASLIHHDGGMEDRFQRIDDLVVGADAVLCPVDCVSHAACRHAKRLCRKFCKRFVPLRTASGAALEGALAELAAVRAAESGDGAR
jgi:hypothetical protein